MKHQTKLTLTSTTPEHIGLMNRPRAIVSIKKKEKLFFFSVNTKYISSRELKTSTFSPVVRARENSDVFNSLDEIYLSRLLGKPTICICENKDADQLRGNREADQRLCFRFSDSTIPLLLKSEISSF